MPNSKGRAVVFRQRFGDLELGQDGMITVGLTGSRQAGWKIAYVSSSAVGTQAAPAEATLSPTEAWLKAAEDVGHPVTSSAISDERDLHDLLGDEVSDHSGVPVGPLQGPGEHDLGHVPPDAGELDHGPGTRGAVSAVGQNPAISS